MEAGSISTRQVAKLQEISLADAAGRLGDMMDKPGGLSASPQAQQQQKNVINRISAA
jgi:hypothetical protein